MKYRTFLTEAHRSSPAWSDVPPLSISSCLWCCSGWSFLIFQPLEMSQQWQSLPLGSLALNELILFPEEDNLKFDAPLLVICILRCFHGYRIHSSTPFWQILWSFHLCNSLFLPPMKSRFCMEEFGGFLYSQCAHGTCWQWNPPLTSSRHQKLHNPWKFLHNHGYKSLKSASLLLLSTVQGIPALCTPSKGEQLMAKITRRRNNSQKGPEQVGSRAGRRNWVSACIFLWGCKVNSSNSSARGGHMQPLESSRCALKTSRDGKSITSHGEPCQS